MHSAVTTTPPHAKPHTPRAASRLKPPPWDLGRGTCLGHNRLFGTTLYRHLELCRTSTPSRNHCSAACKACGQLPPTPQPHKHRARYLSSAPVFGTTGSSAPLSQKTRGFSSGPLAATCVRGPYVTHRLETLYEEERGGEYWA